MSTFSEQVVRIQLTLVSFMGFLSSHELLSLGQVSFMGFLSCQELLSISPTRPGWSAGLILNQVTLLSCFDFQENYGRIKVSVPVKDFHGDAKGNMFLLIASLLVMQRWSNHQSLETSH